MKNKIQVLMLAPGEHPFLEEISTTKSALTKAVNVGIKHNYKPEYKDIDDGISVMHNRHRSFAGLEPNRRIGNDILCGNIYIVGRNADGSLRSLDYDEQVKYSNMFWEPEKYTHDEAQIANLTYTYTKEVLKQDI